MNDKIKQSRNHDDYHERILDVLLYVPQHLDEELSTEAMAERACFSMYHFHRIFKGMTGITLQAYVRRCRLQRASLRLKYTLRPVLEIALESHYSTHEAFTRAFTSEFGHSPSIFRDKYGLRRDETASTSSTDLAIPLHMDTKLYSSKEIAMKIRIEDCNPLNVAFMRHVGPYDQCGELWQKFMGIMGSKGMLNHPLETIGMGHDDPEVTPPEKLRYDACLVVPEDFQAEGEVGVQTIPGGRYAIATHHGAYEGLRQAYGDFYGKWLPGSGEAPRELPPFEKYINSPMNTKPEDLITEIYMPLV
ncbi:AraC family transcriptional regulator [Poriferisphaera sp. WC338]|uniref:AraC family transcriptional regulator n=1 Tax=Poriferisphaera sp. WC338 TaxID=3425129 RepID=UPI003D81BED8